VELDMPRLDPSQGGGRAGDGQEIEIPVLEVDGGAAARADEVVVGREVGVKPDVPAGGADSRDQAELGEQGQSPVDGVERDARQRPVDLAVNGVDVRVVGRRGRLSIDLEALRRQPDLRAAQDAREVVHHRREFPIGPLHGAASK